MKEKRIYPFIVGIITMLLFGLVLGQSILAVFILLNWKGSQFLKLYPALLCIFAGLVQGICEESGRLVAYKTVLKKYTNAKTSILYGLGHGGIEFVYTVIVLVFSNMILSQMAVQVLVRLVLLGGQIALSIFVFASARKKNMRYLYFLAIFFHAVMDAFSIAASRKYISVSMLQENMAYIAISLVMIILSSIVYKKDMF